LNARKEKSALGMKYVHIQPGTFMMGSPAYEPNRKEGEVLHRVTLTRGYYLQTTPVTVGQWRAFENAVGYKTEAQTDGGAYVWTGTEWIKKKGFYWNNPGYEQTDTFPVTCISWNDVQEFIRWLNGGRTGKYRLPSEVEWEYACRAGTKTPFYFGKCLSTDEANYNGYLPYPGCARGKFRNTPVPVMSFKANYWGLYEMHGNVYEWCEDVYHEQAYSKLNRNNPVFKGPGSRRVIRGGRYGSRASSCRSASRVGMGANARYNGLGFRLARTL
jgi:formylglycine-generating enzyme required for sulfatase activity